jgi:mRNA interferase HigB
MRVISRIKLREFWRDHPDAESSLESWFIDVKHADWKNPTDIKNVYRNASFVANNRVVFNIKGNQYRIIVAVHYGNRIVYVRFIGTHQQYDEIDAKTI